MCVACARAGVNCDWKGLDCVTDLNEFDYLSPEEVEYINSTPAFESESMSKKVKVEVAKEDTKDKIIKKQTEVWVYDDEVYATYAKAVSAKHRSRIIELMVRKMYPSASETSIKSYIRSWTAAPQSYTVYGNHVIDIVNTILEESMHKTTAA